MHACPALVLAPQVFGGLVTGMVVKYCDNILKNFALAISVILTVLVAIPLFGQARGALVGCQCVGSESAAPEAEGCSCAGFCAAAALHLRAQDT